ncbi:MAG: glucosaminidase domain-containing protein [Rhodanobacteraceae bacterium]|nr:glucosaminidase domain-containing protein [Rhodanobacteraceae bacterium]
MPAQISPGPLGIDSATARGQVDFGTLARVASPPPSLLAQVAAPKAAAPQSGNPRHVNDFFDDLYPTLKKLAEDVAVEEDCILALSSYESGWYNAHNRGLNNPFGLTKGGGNNLKFASPKAAADYWRETFGPQVRGAKSIDAFVRALLSPPRVYNTVNPQWGAKVKLQHNSVVKRKAIWLAEKEKRQ